MRAEGCHVSEEMPLVMARAGARKISLFGNFGSSNIGNECTLQAIICNIYTLVSKAEIECICPNPSDVSARHNVSAFRISRRIARSSEVGFPITAASLVPRLARLFFVRMPRELGEWVRAIGILKGRDIFVVTGTGMLTDCGEGP